VPLSGIINMPITLILSFLLSYYTIGLEGTLIAFLAIFIFAIFTFSILNFIQFYIGKGIKFCRFKNIFKNIC
jgi:hypothetical protein